MLQPLFGLSRIIVPTTNPKALSELFNKHRDEINGTIEMYYATCEQGGRNRFAGTQSHTMYVSGKPVTVKYPVYTDHLYIHVGRNNIASEKARKQAKKSEKKTVQQIEQFLKSHKITNYKVYTDA